MAIAVGLIGAGVMGADHARMIRTAVGGARLAAVFDTDRARADAVAAAGSGIRTFDDPVALIGDAGVDAVLVASPDSTHHRLVLACLAAGKPVLCEKPLAPTVEECLGIVAAETKLGRRLVTVGFMRRFDPGYAAMRRELESGGLGRALILHCIHRNRTGAPSLQSEGLIVGSAVHEFDIARWLLGTEVTTVTVVKPRKSGLTGAQDPQIILLGMADGSVVDIEVFINAQYGYDVRAELVCERGTTSLIPPAGLLLRQGSREGIGVPDDWRPRFALAYEAELRAWIASIASGVSAGASAFDGAAATAIAAAGVASLHSGAPATVTLAERPALYG